MKPQGNNSGIMFFGVKIIIHKKKFTFENHVLQFKKVKNSFWEIH